MSLYLPAYFILTSSVTAHHSKINCFQSEIVLLFAVKEYISKVDGRGDLLDKIANLESNEKVSNVIEVIFPVYVQIYSFNESNFLRFVLAATLFNSGSPFCKNEPNC